MRYMQPIISYLCVSDRMLGFFSVPFIFRLCKFEEKNAMFFECHQKSSGQEEHVRQNSIIKRNETKAKNGNSVVVHRSYSYLTNIINKNFIDLHISFINKNYTLVFPLTDVLKHFYLLLLI